MQLAFVLILKNRTTIDGSIYYNHNGLTGCFVIIHVLMYCFFNTQGINVKNNQNLHNGVKRKYYKLFGITVILCNL